MGVVENLVGKKIEIKDSKGSENKTLKTITAAENLQNYAGVIVYLDEDKSPFALTYEEATYIASKNND